MIRLSAVLPKLLNMCVVLNIKAKNAACKALVNTTNMAYMVPD